MSISAQISGVINQNPSRVSDGTEVPARMLRDGSIMTGDWLQGLVLEGRVFQAQVGSASSPATFSVAYDALQPELAIDINSRTALVLLEMQFYLETSAGTINEISVQSSTNTRGSGTSTAVSPTNYYVNHGDRSRCNVYSLYSANASALADAAQMFHWGYAFADTTVGPVKHVTWTPRPCPIVRGTASVSVWIAAATTAPTGFILAKWAELDSGDV